MSEKVKKPEIRCMNADLARNQLTGVTYRLENINIQVRDCFNCNGANAGDCTRAILYLD